MGVLPQVTEDLTIIKMIKFVGICFICHKNIMSQNSYYMYYKTLPEHKLYIYGTKFNKKLLQLFQLLICKEIRHLNMSIPILLYLHILTILIQVIPTVEQVLNWIMSELMYLNLLQLSV